MVNSRNIGDLIPIVAAKADNFVAACKAQGIDILIYSTLRDNESQNELYAQGRTKSGKIVTNAKAGESYHNYGCAFDFVPLVHGKPAWDDKTLYTRCGNIAESVGLEWAGRWKGKLQETAHCQYTGGLHWSELKAGKIIT